MQELDTSQYRLRKLIGILGVLLPFILYFSFSEYLNSMSHYYYTQGGVYFIGILFSFGLLLITYKGYVKEGKEKFSDSFITSTAGISILITVLIPTSYSNSGSSYIDNLNIYYLYGHDLSYLNLIHLVSAGIFLALLGVMSYFQFAKTRDNTKRKLFRYCGLVIWGSIGLIIIFILLEKLGIFYIDNYMRNFVFIFETIAVLAFGISWLIKGEILKDAMELRKKLKNDNS